MVSWSTGTLHLSSWIIYHWRHKNSFAYSPHSSSDNVIVMGISMSSTEERFQIFFERGNLFWIFYSELNWIIKLIVGFSCFSSYSGTFWLLKKKNLLHSIHAFSHTVSVCANKRKTEVGRVTFEHVLSLRRPLAASRMSENECSHLKLLTNDLNLSHIEKLGEKLGREFKQHSNNMLALCWVKANRKHKAEWE